MTSDVRLLTVCLACCLTGLAAAPMTALGESSPSGAGSGASSSLGSSLVTPGSPTGSEQAQSAEQAKLASPEAVTAREESNTKFEGLNSEQAAALASQALPAVIDEPAGGPPKLPAGESITGYPTDDAAQVDLPEGEHGVIESMAPMAVETSSGQRAPIDLGLREAGGAVEAANPLVAVRLPKRLSEGAQIPGFGLSLTPVGGDGSSLGDLEASLDGASVFFANTQTA